MAFSLPNVPILRQIGAIVIKHGQLEHVQKIVLKRLLKITIHDERYAREVQGLLSRDLRKKIDAHIKTSALDQPTKAQLIKLLKEAAACRQNAISWCIAYGAVKYATIRARGADHACCETRARHSFRFLRLRTSGNWLMRSMLSAIS